MCVSCYAFQDYPMRKQTSRHVHKKTPKKGLIRLGTYVEVTPELISSPNTCVNFAYG